jgi:succinoglycan biosynthesis protein ExoA
LNRGILVSRGSIIIRMDAHCEYGPDYVRKCVEMLKTTGSDNVGGPQRPKARTFFQRMVSIALGSKLGTGGAAYKHGKDGYVDTVFLGAFKREALKRVGLFDPGAITNEDAEINQRIIASGGKIYLSSKIECYYYPRESVKSLFVQYFKYGRGRARTVLKHKNVLRLSSFAPFLFVFGTAAMLALGALLYAPLLWAGLGALAFYVTALFGEGARLALKNEWRCAFMLPLIFATTHVSHALGVAWGLIYYALNPDWKRKGPPPLRE